jgi:hypothetical protein
VVVFASPGLSPWVESSDEGWEKSPPPSALPALVDIRRSGRVAQLVEHVLGKDEVMGSSPITTSIWIRAGG